jgi:hypothetical protein
MQAPARGARQEEERDSGEGEPRGGTEGDVVLFTPRALR